MIVSACTKKRRVTVSVFARALSKPVNDFGFGHLPWDFQIPIQPIFRGNLREYIINRTRANRLQHSCAISRRFGQIAHKSLLDVFQCESIFSRSSNKSRRARSYIEETSQSRLPSCTFVPFVV